MSVNQYISRADVLQAMEKPECIFSIEFVTYNRKKKEGGERKKIHQACKSNHAYKVTSSGKNFKNDHQVAKNPNHFKNSTRNVKDLISGKVLKLNINLIYRFNGAKVIW